MCSEQLPKEFEKTTEVLPFSKYGLSSMEEFQKAESEIQQLEKFKRAGLSDVEIKLYEQNEAGTIDEKKMESSVLKHKLDVIYDKIRKLEDENDHIKDKASTSHDILKPLEKPLTYPEGHPMNSIKDIESNLFSHLKSDDIPSLSKRRKMLRRFERKKERILAQDPFRPCPDRVARPGSKWDMQELPGNKGISARTGSKWDKQEIHSEMDQPARISSEMQELTNGNDRHISPRPGSKWDMQEVPTDRDRNTPKIQSVTEREAEPRPVPQNRLPMYTIRDNKIVRVEPQERVEDRLAQDDDDENRLAQDDDEDRLTQDNVEDRLAQDDGEDRLAQDDDEDMLAQDDGEDRLAQDDGEDMLAQDDGEDRLAQDDDEDSFSLDDDEDRLGQDDVDDWLAQVGGEDRLAQNDGDAVELLEGTKISVDDIKKIDEHKNYEPGIPSKVLALKNISPSVREEQLKLLFNQFILGNGGPVRVQMFQDRETNNTAYVYFQNEDTAIQALGEANGTVVAGRPIVAYFKTAPRHR